jgi:hypothetical protein
VKTTCQFSSKIFYPDNATPSLWSTDPLDNHRISDDRFNFYADNVSFELSEDGNSYNLRSSRSTKTIVDVKITKTAPGFKCGKNGTSYFGTDPERPWGQMFHAFWPRCAVEGSFITPSGPIDFAGQGMYSFALQGMKPHHAGTTECSPFLEESMILTAPWDSFKMELYQLPIPFIQCHHDGIHDPT